MTELEKFIKEKMQAGVSLKEIIKLVKAMYNMYESEDVEKKWNDTKRKYGI